MCCVQGSRSSSFKGISFMLPFLFWRYFYWNNPRFGRNSTVKKCSCEARPKTLSGELAHKFCCSHPTTFKTPHQRQNLTRHNSTGSIYFNTGVNVSKFGCSTEMLYLTKLSYFAISGHSDCPLFTQHLVQSLETWSYSFPSSIDLCIEFSLTFRCLASSVRARTNRVGGFHNIFTVQYFWYSVLVWISQCVSLILTDIFFWLSCAGISLLFVAGWIIIVSLVFLVIRWLFSSFKLVK